MKVHLAATGILKKFPAELAKCEFILESFYSVTSWQIPFLLNAKSFLLDSGAFTFLRSGKRVDWDEYVSRYAKFINEHGVKQYFELDIDKIIGFDAVLDIRRRLERETGVKPIPVWHRSRGLERFKRDASDYPYIAIGGLAIKDIKPQEYEFLPYFIDEAHKRGAIVHGLGFTDTKRYKTIKFDTVDSTTWAVGGKYGCICEFDGDHMTQRKTDGKRCINQNGLMLYNYNEWLEYQRYAKTHFRRGRKHHGKNQNFNASGMALDTFCIVLSDKQYSCGKTICLAVRSVDDCRRYDDVPDNLHSLRHLFGGLRLQMEPDNLLYGVRHESTHGGAVPDRDNFTPSPFYAGQEAFAQTLGNAPRILAASLAAYVIGDFANDKVFRKMKERHAETMKGYGWRAILSSLVGEMCDSCVFIPIAFIGTLPVREMIVMAVTQVCLKVGYEIVVLPLSTLACRKVRAYEIQSSR